MTLRTRLTVVYTSVFGLLLAAVSAVSYVVLARQLDADATANLVELTDGLHGYLRFNGEAPNVSFDLNDTDEAAFVHEATRYYQIFDADSGRLIVQSEGLEPLGLHFTPSEVRAFLDRRRTEDIRTDYGRIRLSNSLLAPSPGRTYLLQVGASLDGMDRTLTRFLDLLLWSAPLGMLAAALTGRWMTSVALAPLSRLAGAARTIGIADLATRLPIRGTSDELDEVALAFNETLGRLERAIGEMRQFSTALAHELRTPLAALRGEIEMAALVTGPGGYVAHPAVSQLEEIDKLTGLIDQLLMLARAEAGEIPIARDSLNLGAVAAGVVEQLDLVAKESGIDLTAELSDEVVVHGDAQWLERLLLNLVDNALKFTPPGGRVVVRLTRDERAAVLQVSDTGMGIAPDALPHVFERFFRADPSRSSLARGAGLGLSLVKWIVDQHHGTITVESRPGQGSTFTVRLPHRRL